VDIYQRKRIWKAILFMVSIIIFIGSVVYANILVSNIKDDERKQVELWANAIQEKAELVNVTENLFTLIAEEEKKKVELLAAATKQLERIVDPQYGLEFYFKIIKNNTTIPVILTNSNKDFLSVRNIDDDLLASPAKRRVLINSMQKKYPPIHIQVSPGVTNYLYYNDSKIFTQLRLVLDDYIKSFITDVVLNSANVSVVYTDKTQENIIAYNIKSATYMLSSKEKKMHVEAKVDKILGYMKKQNTPIPVELRDATHYVYYLESETVNRLKWFPYIQFLVIGIFVAVAYFLFSIGRKAEQDQVWVGMSKETAHQLGTPISSMMAWLELLKSQYPEDDSIYEMERDVNRLEVITERFSKIGSTPSLDALDVYETLNHAVYYLKKRVSKRVEFVVKENPEPLFAMLNRPLFEWVIENISKNAVDAMEGIGTITFSFIEENSKIHIDIKDTGKGMTRKLQKEVFEPGITTKKRGWGLGLTLARRIINNYHKGNITVKHSEIDKGTTFRISLNKAI